MNISNHFLQYKNIYLTIPIIFLYWFTCKKVIDIFTDNKNIKTKQRNNNKNVMMLIISILSMLLGYTIYKKCHEKSLPISGGIFLCSMMMLIYYVIISWYLFSNIIKLLILGFLMVGAVLGTQHLLSILPKTIK